MSPVKFPAAFTFCASYGTGAADDAYVGLSLTDGRLEIIAPDETLGNASCVSFFGRTALASESVTP